jgi:hypothetical protein
MEKKTKFKKPKGHYKRQWLNKTKGAASIITNVDIDRWGVNAWFEINDCNRKVNIDMDFYNMKSLQVKIDKINLVINQLCDMRDYLIDNESTIKDVFERQQKEFQVVNVSEDEE